MRPSALLIPLSILLLTSAAQADDAPADKSGYTLFNPVPDDQMRSFSPDRPTKLNGPITVDAGHFQYEADFVTWTYDRHNANDVTTSNFVFADPTFKLGVTKDVDLELVVTPYVLNTSHDRAANTNSVAGGFGDMTARVKYNLFGNDGGDYALAIVPYVKIPTASHIVGNQRWEGGGYAPFSITLPDNWSLTLQTEIDAVENAALDGTHVNYQNAASIAHPIFVDNLTAAVDFWSLVDGDRNAQKQYTGDFALSWMVNDNTQLDGGINVGLNRAAPDTQIYFGISQRY